MAHHKKKLKVNTYGNEMRVRRDRKGSVSKLTKEGRHFSHWPEVDPLGKPPGTGWVLGGIDGYSRERKRRKERALEKQRERRRIRRREDRRAFKEQE